MKTDFSITGYPDSSKNKGVKGRSDIRIQVPIITLFIVGAGKIKGVW